MTCPRSLQRQSSVPGLNRGRDLPCAPKAAAITTTPPSPPSPSLVPCFALSLTPHISILHLFVLKDSNHIVQRWFSTLYLVWGASTSLHLRLHHVANRGREPRAQDIGTARTSTMISSISKSILKEFTEIVSKNENPET